MLKYIIKKMRRADSLKIYIGIFVKKLSLIMPKDKKLILVVPRFSSVFSGNLKYIYLYLANDRKADFEAYLVLKKGALSNQLKQAGYPVIEHPTIYGLYALLRAKTVIVESTRWGKMLKSAATHGATRYQVWHGNGMKNVAMANAVVTDRISDPKKERMYNALDIYPNYDYMVFSSKLQHKARSHSFNFKDYVINGQPRDDIILGKKFEGAEIGAEKDTIDVIKKAKNEGRHIVLLSPTWRPKYDYQPIHAVNAIKLNDFCESNNILIVYKPHPKEFDKFPVTNNIIRYGKNSDIYPAFKYFDAMVTDYSSIFMDFILLDKPVIFFLYDRSKYEDSRGLQHDIDDVCPGPICQTQEQLHDNLLGVVRRRDDYKEKRSLVVREFNDFKDKNNCKRLVGHIESEVKS